MLTAIALSLTLSTYPVTIPDGLEFGLDSTAHSFDTICTSHTTRQLDPAEMPLANDSHVQIDCEGFDYFGAERLAEFVFADGRLTHVWILVEEAELDSLQMAFESEFGEPDREAPVFVAFFEACAAVRRDVPEALYYGADAAALFEAFFSQ